MVIMMVIGTTLIAMPVQLPSELTANPNLTEEKIKSMIPEKTLTQMVQDAKTAGSKASTTTASSGKDKDKNKGKPCKALVKGPTKQVILNLQNAVGRMTGLNLGAAKPDMCLTPCRPGEQRMQLTKEQAWAMGLTVAKSYFYFCNVVDPTVIQQDRSKGSDANAAVGPGQARWDTTGMIGFKQHLRITMSGDEGSEGFSAFMFMAVNCTLAILFHRDSMHKMKRLLEGMGNAVPGFKLMIKQTMQIYKSPAGPWNGGKFKQQIAEAAKILCKEFDRNPEHPLLEFFGPGIAADAGMQDGYTSADLIDFYRKQMRRLGCTSGANSGRWMSWVDNSIEHMPMWNCFAMTLAELKMQQGQNPFKVVERRIEQREAAETEAKQQGKIGAAPSSSASESILDTVMEARAAQGT